MMGSQVPCRSKNTCEMMWTVEAATGSDSGLGKPTRPTGLGYATGNPMYWVPLKLRGTGPLGTIGSALTGRFETACQRCEASQVLQLGTPNQLFGWPS